MGYYQIPPRHAPKKSCLDSESGVSMEQIGDVCLDVPIRVACGSAWLDVAGIGDVAEVPECFAFGLGLFTCDEDVEFTTGCFMGGAFGVVRVCVRVCGRVRAHVREGYLG